MIPNYKLLALLCQALIMGSQDVFSRITEEGLRPGYWALINLHNNAKKS